MLGPLQGFKYLRDTAEEILGFGCGNAQDSPAWAGRDESRDEPEETDGGRVLKKIERKF